MRNSNNIEEIANRIGSLYGVNIYYNCDVLWCTHEFKCIDGDHIIRVFVYFGDEDSVPEILQNVCKELNCIQMP